MMESAEEKKELYGPNLISVDVPSAISLLRKEVFLSYFP